MNYVTLGKIAEFINGYAFKPSDWSNEGLSIIRIQNLTDSNKPFNKTTKPVPDKYVVHKGDLLISWSATLGIFEWEKEEDALLNQHIFKVLLDLNLVEKRYFMYVLQHTIAKMSQFTHGSTMKHIVRGDFLKHQIPLPDLRKQKLIVELLDKANALRQKRNLSIQLLDQYLKSVYLEMFGDPINNPLNLKLVTLEKLTSKITDGTHKTPNYMSEGVKFISAKNIKKESIDWTDVKYISEEEHRSIYKRCNPEKGDLLLTKSGSLGMLAIVDVDFEFSLFESLALLKINKELVDPIYLKEYLNLEQIKSLYLNITKGVGVKHLHLIDIKSLQIILPPLDQQKKFVNLVMKNRNLKQKMIEQADLFEVQFQSQMQRSFASS